MAKIARRAVLGWMAALAGGAVAGNAYAAPRRKPSRSDLYADLYSDLY